MTTATITATPICHRDLRPDVFVVRVDYSDGREPLTGVAHLNDAADSPDPTGWCTGSLAQAEPDVLRAIREGRDDVNITPAISAAALAEYLVSPPLRRMHLLERAKYPMGQHEHDKTIVVEGVTVHATVDGDLDEAALVKAVGKRARDIAAACVEIRRVWPTV